MRKELFCVLVEMLFELLDGRMDRFSAMLAVTINKQLFELGIPVEMAVWLHRGDVNSVCP